MEPALLAAYDRPVPRYTSYPTAAQFTASVGAAEHARWLGDLAAGSAALYLHVPFCRQLCWYCACHTMAMRQEGTLQEYGALLQRELDLVAAAAPGVVLDAVQWGGGTPSQLGPPRILEIGRRIAALFDRRADAEISMEIDPRYCTSELAEAMAGAGVTRASLGVQDFDDAVQQAINRIQTLETTAKALQLLRSVGIVRANIDLVYGLPSQTPEKLARTLDQAIALGPDRFAVFAYAHVPWMKPHQKLIDAATLPDAPMRARMAALVAERLVAAGYLRVGLDHYARSDDALARATADGTLQRSFQGYVADGSRWVIGVGASAISSLPGGFSQNVVDAAQYMAVLETGRFATARGIAVDTEDRLRGEIIGSLMCSYEADVADVCRRRGVALEPFLESVRGLGVLQRDGLIEIDRGRVAVTDRGRPLVRSVCAAFDRYYTGAEGRHSRGI
jgi:oxygen-independent coproporphyrinogen III oxidase